MHRDRSDDVSDIPVPSGFPDGFASGTRCARRAPGARVVARHHAADAAPPRVGEGRRRRGVSTPSESAVRGARTTKRSPARPIRPRSRNASRRLGARFVVPGDDEYVPCPARPPARSAARPVRAGSLAHRSSPRPYPWSAPATAPRWAMRWPWRWAPAWARLASVSSAARPAASTPPHIEALSPWGVQASLCSVRVWTFPIPRAVLSWWSASRAAGAVVTEYAPGVEAEPFRFPARNRLVAALGKALVVVEGAEGSGSMISVDHAIDLGRDVYAVPGPVTSPLAEVPLALIREGATLIRGAADLLADLGFGGRRPRRHARRPRRP